MLRKQLIRMNIRKATLFVATVTVAATAFLGSSPSVAALSNDANTLKVSPVRSDIKMKPGTSKKVKTTVTNLTDKPITVRPIENDFISGDENGTPALILDANKYAPTHSLKRFMSPLSDVTIPANKSKTIEVVITVPKDAQAGGYFGAVRFAPATSEDSGQVNLNASVASIILLEVPGDAIEKLVLTNFDVERNGKSGGIFQTSDNFQVFTRFENKGSVQMGPFGKISVKKGDKVVYETDFNDSNPRDMILPDSARRWNIPLDKIDGFGEYTVSATFTYGTKNQTINVTDSFWIVPMSVIIIAIVGLLVLIGLIVGTILFVRRRHHRRHGARRNFGQRRR